MGTRLRLITQTKNGKRDHSSKRVQIHVDEIHSEWEAPLSELVVSPNTVAGSATPLSFTDESAATSLDVTLGLRFAVANPTAFFP